MNKLFEVPASPRDVIFRFETYKGNRIALKLLKLMRADPVFKIKSVESPNENRIFEISIFSGEDLETIISKLKGEFISYIPDNFPSNYMFDFSGKRLGFIHSFQVFNEMTDELCFELFHRNKEVRTDGKSIVPDFKNQITT